MAERNLKGDVNVEFAEASSRQGLDSGESVKTLFGKLRKWLSDLKPVAFSGSYGDLSNKPTIPTVNNGTLTIQKNGTTKVAFTANQAGDVTANIETGDAYGIDMYDDTLPINITARGDNLEDWVIYGNDEGVGQKTAQELPITQPITQNAGYVYNGSLVIDSNYLTILTTNTVSIALVDKNGTTVFNNDVKANVSTSISTPNGVVQCRIYSVNNITNGYITIVADNTTLTEYIPYGYELPIITHQYTENLYNKNTKISGYRIQWATGALISWQSGQMSDYIEINQSSYKCTIPVFILGYTENYTYCGALRDGAFVKESPSEFNESFTISDTNVKYIKLLNYAYPETAAYSFPDDMMLVEGNELPASFIPYEYVLSSTIYLGTSPLTEGQSLSKSQAATKDIFTFNGECIIDTSLSNKPRMEIIPTDSAINIINRLKELTQKALLKEEDNAGGYVVDLDKDCKLQRNANYIYLRNNSINLHTDSSNISLQCGTTGSPLRGVQITNTAVRMYFGLNTLTVDESGLWFNNTKIAE